MTKKLRNEKALTQVAEVLKITLGLGGFNCPKLGGFNTRNRVVMEVGEDSFHVSGPVTDDKGNWNVNGGAITYVGTFSRNQLNDYLGSN